MSEDNRGFKGWSQYNEGFDSDTQQETINRYHHSGNPLNLEKGKRHGHDVWSKETGKTIFSRDQDGNEVVSKDKPSS